jgi:hypothetical protein
LGELSLKHKQNEGCKSKVCLQLLFPCRTRFDDSKLF